MSRLSERVKKLERPSSSWSPAPFGGVAYAGTRDPVAVVRALDLDKLNEVTLEVLSAGADPEDPPWLVGGLTESGRHGMSDELRQFSEQASYHFDTGEAWSLHWRRGRTGFVLDRSAPDWLREYQCRSEPNVGP